MTYQEANSIFASNGKHYDLNVLFKLVENKPIKTVLIDHLVWQLDRKLDPARIDRVDLSYPILITEDPDGFILIVDGEHRTHKAIESGLRDIQAKQITPEELEQARIAPPKSIISLFSTVTAQEIQYFREYYEQEIANHPAPITVSPDTTVNTVNIPSLVLIARPHTKSEWKIVSNPDFTRLKASERLAAQILGESFVDYVEYSNCGVFYKVIRESDLDHYLGRHNVT